MGSQTTKKNNLQLTWGIALTLVGIAVFVNIPQKMAQIEKIQQFAGATGFIRICLYLMAIILVGGGVKKLTYYFQKTKNEAKSGTGIDTADQ